MKNLKNLANQPIPNYQVKPIPYTANISRTTPSALVILLDQSGSMGFNKVRYQDTEAFPSQIVTDMINKILDELIGRCTKEDGIRDYFDISLIGYGGQDTRKANFLWQGKLSGKTWVSVSELKNNAQYEKRQVAKMIRGQMTIKEVDVPYWFTPVAKHRTPMVDAFDKAFQLLKDWVQNHGDCYPPVVINITDGQYTDNTAEEFQQAASNIKALHTKDGHALLINCHISSKGQTSAIFPPDSNFLPGSDAYARQLFDASSEMPKSYNDQISRDIRNDPDAYPTYHGMAYNANMDQLFKLLDIGTSYSR